MTAQAQVSEPTILTANTYFWTSGASASNRRRNEERNLATVADFFRALGMQVSVSSDSVVGHKDGIRAVFSYSESCKNVYKSLSITRDGKSSNITSLRKLYK